MTKLKYGMDVLCHLIRSRVKGTPFKLNFAVTSKCNGHCLGCNVWRARPSHNELTTSEIERVFRNLSYGLIWISFTGGEPFLRGDFVEIVASAVKNIKSLKMISIPTNGLLTELILEKLRAILKADHPLVYLSVSLDGPEGVHNELRGEEHAFKRAWETYVKVQELARTNKDCLVNIEATISKRNVAFLPAFIKKMHQGGHKPFINLFNVGFLYKNADMANMPFESCTPEVQETLKNVSEGLSWLKGEDWIKRIYIRGIGHFLQQRRLLPCVSLKSSFAMSCEGDVLPCLIWDKRLGNVRDYDYDVKKIWNTIQAREVLQLIREGRCPKCWTPCEVFQAIIDPWNYLNCYKS